MTHVDRQSLWGMLVGVPIGFSALHLWVQSGGDGRLTLLLVQSVDLIGFFATMVLSGLWAFVAVPVWVFAFGGLVSMVAPGSPERFAFTRWSLAAPVWLKWTVFLLAAATWPVMVIPMCALGLALAFRWRGLWPKYAVRRWLVLGACVPLAMLASGPVTPLIEPWGLIPPLLAIAPLVLVAGGLLPGLARLPVVAVIRAIVLLSVVVGLIAAHGVITTPLLPSTALEVAMPGFLGPPQLVRGYVISEDENVTTVLREDGGMEIVSSRDVVGRVSCLVPRTQSRYQRYFGLALDESVLRRFAESRRQTGPPDPRCIRTPDR